MPAGKPPLPDHIRRGKTFPIRLKDEELQNLKAASRRFGMPASDLVRRGLELYLAKLERQGESKRKERK
ncbi:MAG TPA: ribbon-helix-helix domain-containing protein [Acidobacteriota bacterium]|jgi:predicted DNA-binding protein